jgi:hypothetical protein
MAGVLARSVSYLSMLKHHIFLIYISFNVCINLKPNISVKCITFSHCTFLSVGWDTVVGKGLATG